MAHRLRIALFCLGGLGFLGGAEGLSGCKAQTPTPKSVSQQWDAGADAAVRAAGEAADGHPNGCLPGHEHALAAERDAVTLDLARHPDDPETLAEAAALYLGRLPQTTLRSEIGLLYARRGSELITQRLGAGKDKRSGKAQKEPQKLLRGRLALLEGQALVDLGRAREALPRLDTALQLGSTDHKLESEAYYERAVALFELCQLAQARQAFETWLARYAPSKDELRSSAINESRPDAWAHHHLGLVLEMLGQTEAAEREFASARRLEPDQFFDPLPISQSEFQALVDSTARALPPQSAADLSLVSLFVADLPDRADLTLEEPPLSPTILGLFRGLPLGEEPSEPRAIVLYRKNLLRVARTRSELLAEVRTTLLHELGHLRGADDDELRRRGLE